MARGLSSDGLARLDEVAARHVADGSVPGVVALVARGDDPHVCVAGSLTTGGAKAERDSLFRIASMTKPITAAAVLALAEEGLLDVDEDVDRLVPELSARRVLRRMDGPLDDTVAAERAITIKDLLTFTFGFGTTMEMFAAPQPWPVVAEEAALHLSTLGPPNPAEQPGPDEWIAALGTLPLLAHPGERWLYNTGASVLGVVAARAAGMPFGEVLATRLFEPLGMRETAMWAAESDRLATAYRSEGGSFVEWDPPDGVWSRPQRFEDGAAGLVSTVDDLLCFSRMLLGGGGTVLSGASVAAMTTDQLTSAQRARDGIGILLGRGWGYCQSVLIEGPRAGAFGWDGGFGSTWLMDPARDLTVIVLTQRMFDSPAAPQVHGDLQDAAYAALA